MEIVLYISLMLSTIILMPSEFAAETTTEEVPPAVSKVAENLPQPEAQRSPSRSSLRRTSSSYDPREAFESFSVNRNSISKFDSPETLDTLSLMTSDSNSELYFGEEKSDSEFAEKTGYGYTCTSGYINASAVALLAFLFLLHIIQDIITEVIAGRKKRDADYSSLMIQILLRSEGLQTFYDDIPHIVIPLLVKLVDNYNEKECMAFPVCESNLELSEEHGPIGRVFGTLLSNVVSYVFTFGNSKAFQSVQDAASFGRSESSCSKFKDCSQPDIDLETNETIRS